MLINHQIHNTGNRFPLSVVILTRNEESNIVRCLEGVQWCDDVVVIDDGSTDRTVELATIAGVRVVNHAFQDFATQRNWAMEHASLKHEWVLHLDADEVVTPELQNALRETLLSTPKDVVAFRMCRKTMLGETWLKYSDGFPVWIMRLVRRGAALFQSSGHGEVAVPPVDGKVETLAVPFLHFAFSKGWTNWIDRHNRYSLREAQLEASQDAPIRIGAIFSRQKDKRRLALRSLSRRLPFRPLLRFLYQYILKFGFLDGPAGFTFCKMMAEYERWIVLKHGEILSAKDTSSLEISPVARRVAN